MKIRITDEILKLSRPCDPAHCAVAQFLRYEKSATSIHITTEAVRFNLGGKRWIYDAIPAFAILKIQDFDDEKPIEPFEFTLRNPFSKPIRINGPQLKPRKKGYKIKPRSATVAPRRYHGVKVIRDNGPAK